MIIRWDTKHDNDGLSSNKSGSNEHAIFKYRRKKWQRDKCEMNPEAQQQRLEQLARLKGAL